VVLILVNSGVRALGYKPQRFRVQLGMKTRKFLIRFKFPSLHANLSHSFYAVGTLAYLQNILGG
jgi:hypothetical protein